MAHHRAPDKDPRRRLQMLIDAGELCVPFTTGILVGIGETMDERVDSLCAIREVHAAYGHIQEVIIQNFRAKPGTALAGASGPSVEEHVQTVAVARLLLGGEMNIQAPPNLSMSGHRWLLRAGINDWGGISPVTRDYVNPEAPWPDIDALARTCQSEGFTLAERLAIYPEYVERRGFLGPELVERVATVSAALARLTGR